MFLLSKVFEGRIFYGLARFPLNSWVSKQNIEGFEIINLQLQGEGKSTKDGEKYNRLSLLFIQLVHLLQQKI